MKTHILSAFLLATLLSPASADTGTPPPVAEAGKPVALRESTEWTDVWLTDTGKTNKPHVLLVGDSITKGYQAGVTQTLAGKAYVGYLVTSLCVCDPAFELTLKAVLSQQQFAVIHFNNGLHGVGYTEEQYRDGYAKALKLIREMQPQAKIIVVLSTPLKEGSNKAFLNPRIDQRNESVKVLAADANLPVDDLNTPMKAHPEYHSDPYHYLGKAIAIQAAAVAESISAQLSR